MSTGLGKGLAVQHDFGANIDRLYKQENLRSQIRVEKERKAQMYGEMLKGTHVRGKYNTQRLEEYYNDLNGKVANFVTENPGWETDPGLFAEFSSLSEQYLNNPIVQEDIQVQANFEALQQKVASGSMSIDDINSQMDAYSNYTENGGDPYVFVNPKEVNYNDLVSESARLVGHETKDQTRTLHGITQSRTVKAAVDANIDQRVKADFSDKDNARSIIAAYNQAGGRKVAETAQQWHFDKIKAAQNMDATQWHFDRYELALATKQANSPSGGSMYRRYVHDGYMQAVQSGEDREFSARPANAALTRYGGTGTDQNISAADGFRFTGSFEDVNGQNKYLADEFGFNASTKSTGAGKFVVMGGLPYVEMHVDIDVPVGKNDEPVDGNYAKALTDNGFTLGSFKSSDPFSGITGKSGTSKAQVYSGTLLVPANIDQMSMSAFDDAMYGADQLESLQLSGEYGRMEVESAVSKLQTRYPNREFAIQGNKVFDKATGFEIDPITFKVKPKG